MGYSRIKTSLCFAVRTPEADGRGEMTFSRDFNASRKQAAHASPITVSCEAGTVNSFS